MVLGKGASMRSRPARWSRWVAAAVAALVFADASAARADPRALNTARALARTPPMGFNNWARFQCAAQAPLAGAFRDAYGFQDFMLDQGRALVTTGLAAAGYRTVVVDDCWMERGSDGRLRGVANWGSFRHPSAQPGFEADLSHYMVSLHALGLQGGLYNTSGETTCQRVAAGEAGHQEADAAQFRAWGADFLKLDNCGAADEALQGLFQTMALALGHGGAEARPILFDLSAPAQFAPTDPMKYQAMAWVRPLGQMWRVAPDIRITHTGAGGRSLYDPWSFNDAAQGYEEGVYQAFTDAVALARYVAPGDWNDADQLLIGDNGLTTAEERSQMSLWSIMGAPLIISADVRKLAAAKEDGHLRASLAILKNRRVIAIDQDRLGAGGYLVYRESSADDVGADVAVKPLADGGIAFVVLNKAPLPRVLELPLQRLGLSPSSCTVQVTDLWTGRTTPLKTSGAQQAVIAPHDVLMARIAPAACAAFVPEGQISAAQAAFASPPRCLEAGGDGKMTLESCTGRPRQAWRMEPDGRVRTAGGDLCLSAAGDADDLRLAVCAGDLSQRFSYSLSGALAAQGGRCLEASSEKVGAGGLIGQQGARVRVAPCRPFAPQQTFSAPTRGPLASAAGAD